MPKIVNGTPVDQTTTNAAFIYRDEDDVKYGKLGLADTDPGSGAAVTNTQKAVNKIYEGLGTTGENDTSINDYSSTNYISDGQSRKAAIETLDGAVKTTNDRVDTTNSSLSDLYAIVSSLSGGAGMQAILGYRDTLGLSDGTTSSYVLTETPNFDFAIVFANGALLPFTDYSTTTNNINFSVIPSSGTYLEVFYFSSTQNDQLDGENLSGTVNDVNTVFTFTKTAKSADGVNVYINGVYRRKTDYSIDIVTKTITFVTAPESGSTLQIVLVTGSTVCDSYQVKAFTGNGSQTTFTSDVKGLNSASTLVTRNGLLVETTEYTLSQYTLTFTTAPLAGDEIDIIFYAVYKGAFQLTKYRTVTAAENTSRTVELDIEPYDKANVLLDVKNQSFLVYQTDFSIAQDTITLLNTTSGNAVVTNSVLRIFYKA